MPALNIKTAFRSALASLLLGVMFAAGAMAESDTRDVVRDARGGIITSTWGGCVRTKWDIGSDPCAPQAAKQEKHIRRARDLAQEARTVYFGFNKSEIMPSEQTKLDSLAQVLKYDKEVRSVHIAGYADRIGSISYNKQLSQRRAVNVERYLHRRDYLNTSLAQVRWLGKSAPITHCPNSLKRKELIACLQKDRRVEVDIDYYPARK